MRIAVLFNKTRPDTTGIYFERAGRALGHTVDHWSLDDASRIPASYDLYLRIDYGDDYSLELPPRLRPMAFYAIDTHLPGKLRKIRRVADRSDFVMCCHQDATARLREAVWLPLACDWELHHAPDGPPAWDVGFVGQDGGIPRKFILQAIRERYPNSFVGTAEHTRLGEIYGRCRIGFNYSIGRDVNMRLFEVLAAGALLVTNDTGTDDLKALRLADRAQLVLYRNPRQLMELLDYYLLHDEERRRIAQAGSEAVREHHTYAHRMRRLLALCAKRFGLRDG